MRCPLVSVLACLLVSVLTTPGRSDILLVESFDYELGELDAQDGGMGFGEPWNANTEFIEVVEPEIPLSYDVPGGGTIIGGNRALRLANEGESVLADDQNVLSRALESTVDEEDVFFSYLYRYDAGAVDDNDFVVWWFNDQSGPNIGLKGNLGNGSGTDDIVARLKCCGAPQQQYAPGWDISEEAETIGSDFLVVGHLFKSENTDAPGDYDQYDIWVNPAIDDESSPQASGMGAAGDVFIEEINAIGMRAFSQEPGDVMLWDELRIGTTWDEVLAPIGEPPPPFQLSGSGETYRQDFDAMQVKRRSVLPKGWTAEDNDGTTRRVDGLGLTDGFLTVPGSSDDGVLGILNLGGNSESFGPAPADHIPTWTAELVDSNPANALFGRDDVIADNATDRALGVSRENNDHVGELHFEIEIADANLRAFVLDWDLEIWGGDPDAAFRSLEGPGMKVDVTVGATSYHTMARNLHPGDLFDSLEDGGDPIHNATLIDGNLHSVRGISSGIKEVSDADGAVGNMIQVNFDTNWNDATDGGPNGWFSAVDNVRLRALAPGDADANGVVDVTDLLQLLGGQKFNKGVDGVTWEQGDFNADDQFDTGDLLAMLSFLSGTFPSNPYASEAGASSDAAADVIVNSETGEVTVDLAGHTVSAVIIESAAEIFNGVEPDWDTTSQFPSTLPGELGNVLFTSTASGVDELGVVISAEFLGRDKEFYLQDLDLNILIASEGGALTKGNVIVVPEPSTWALLLIGTLLVGWRQAKRSPGKQ